MKEFFILQRASKDYAMNNFEQFVPIMITIIILLSLIIYKNKIRNNSKIEKLIRYSLTIISLAIFMLYYLIIWTIIGIKLDNLPLHLCYICNILCVILGFTKNKKIFNFVIILGVMGGIGSLVSMDTSLSSMYFKYYQFMVSHISIIIIPIYFLLIHKYYLHKREVIEVFIVLEILGISMGFFNFIFETNYFFVSFNSNLAAKGTILEGVGEGYNYFINLELIAIVYMGFCYLFVKILEEKNNRKSKVLDNKHDYN